MCVCVCVALLRIFESKILRKIYGPIQEGDVRRIRVNEELNRSMNGKEGYCEIHKCSKDKLVGTCKKNGSGRNAKNDGGMRTVHRQKKRKTSFEMDG